MFLEVGTSVVYPAHRFLVRRTSEERECSSPAVRASQPETSRLRLAA